MQVEEEADSLASGANARIDARPEEEFDQIAGLAAALCRTPVSSVMLLDQQRRWYRATGSLRLHGPSVDPAFCDATLEASAPLVLEDTLGSPNFRDNPQVQGSPYLRFYAGAPLYGDSGRAIGVLCVLDVVPRVLAPDQEEGLAILARQLKALMELREQRRELQDLIQQKEAATADLRASEELFRAFMNASPFLSFIKDAAGRLLFYNKTFARRFGITEYAWLGRTDDQLWSRSPSAPVRMHDIEVMAGTRVVESEEQIHGPDAIVTTWKTYKFPCHDSSGNALLAGVAVDITEEVARKAELERYQEEMQEANAQLRRLSVTDELTGLRNRRAFEERLLLEFSMARRRKRSLAVLLLDVDFFKRINDGWGHGAGDAVLRRLGAVLCTTVRLPDLVARYGGEEFVVLLPDSGEDAALGLANRLMERIASEPWDHAPVTVSIGIAALSDGLLNGLQLVTQADEALYAAKRAGKNRVVLHRAQKSASRRPAL